MLLLAAGCTQPAELGPGMCDGDHGDLATQSFALSSVNCAERSDTGYVEGRPFSIQVVTIDDKPVEVATANAYMVMAEAASRDGVEIRINSGFRTQEQQQYLYACYTNCNCNNCNLAARPGYSNHQSGHALDLNTSAPGVLDWLNRNGARFGFSRTVPSEPWHWEWWGGGPGGGPCGRQEPPTAEACPALGPEGGEIDETSGCFYAKGPSQYWRKVDSAGHGGSLMWTNAFRADAPSNWARWYVPLTEAGRYAVEIWAEPGYAIYNAARYVVAHAGTEDTVEVNLSGGTGWIRVGVFDFAAGDGQHVSVYDNYAGDVPPEQKIPADAIRLVPVTEEPAEEPPAEPPPSEEPGLELPDEREPAGGQPSVTGDDLPKGAGIGFDPEQESPEGVTGGGSYGLRGGCATGGTPDASGLPFVLASLLALMLGRRAAR